MGLGERLQGVKSRVYTKMGKQDGPVIVRKTTVVRGADIIGGGQTETNSDVTISQGVKLGHVKAYQTGSAGRVKLGDFTFDIPGDLITEAQLTNAVVVYGGGTYDIQLLRPSKIVGGVAVSWLVIARLKA
jgi:hypothetical protein